MGRIPVYVRIKGRAQMIQSLTEDDAAAMVSARRLRPIYGRRGHLKACLVIERLTGLIHLERTGYCRMQKLSCGQIYTLLGTPGSEDVCLAGMTS